MHEPLEPAGVMSSSEASPEISKRVLPDLVHADEIERSGV